MQTGGLTGTVDKTPTLGSVQAAQEQHLQALRRLVARAEKIAGYLNGNVATEGATSGKPPIHAGCVYSMHDNMMEAASLGESVAFTLQRIEQALGIPMFDDALPEPDTRPLGGYTGQRFAEAPGEARRRAAPR